MCLRRLKERVPSAKKIAVALVEDYKLIINKASNDGSAKANIEPYRGASVYGIVFEIDNSEKSYLDKAEGLGKGYDESELLCKAIDSDETYMVQLYVANKEFLVNNINCYDWYKEFIIAGALENGLPIEYLTLIKSIPVVIDPNNHRRNKQIAILNSVSY